MIYCKKEESVSQRIRKTLSYNKPQKSQKFTLSFIVIRNHRRRLLFLLYFMQHFCVCYYKTIFDVFFLCFLQPRKEKKIIVLHKLLSFHFLEQIERECARGYLDK